MRARGGQGVGAGPSARRAGVRKISKKCEMIAAGEAEVAVDELRWLVETCPEMIEAHYLLGKLAVESMGDVALGRGHFGFGYQLGQRRLAKAENPDAGDGAPSGESALLRRRPRVGVVLGGARQARHGGWR